jgi:hypothetical protein
MPVNKTIRNIYLTAASFFQLYLAFASTLYIEWRSFSFLLVALTTAATIFVIIYFCVSSEREPDKTFS